MPLRHIDLSDSELQGIKIIVHRYPDLLKPSEAIILYIHFSPNDELTTYKKTSKLLDFFQST